MIMGATLYGWINYRYGTNFQYGGLGSFFWGFFFIVSIMFPLFLYWLLFQRKRRRRGIQITINGYGGIYFIILLVFSLALICFDAFIYVLQNDIDQTWRIGISITNLCSMIIFGIPFGIAARRERKIIDVFVNELKWDYDLSKVSKRKHLSLTYVKKIIKKMMLRGWISGKFKDSIYQRSDLGKLTGEIRNKFQSKAEEHEKEDRFIEAFKIYMMLDNIKKADKLGREIIKNALSEGKINKAFYFCEAIKDWELADKIKQKEITEASQLDLKENLTITKKDNSTTKQEPAKEEVGEKSTPEKKDTAPLGSIDGKDDKLVLEDWSTQIIQDADFDKEMPPPPPDSYKEILSKQDGLPARASVQKFIPKYTITHKIGSGGFATVYKAEDNKIGSIVAIKLPKFLDETLDDSIYRKFESEARIWKKLKHKNIVKIYGSDIEPIPHIIMELMEGGDLKHLLLKHKFSIPESMEVMLQISDGMAFAHRMASVHRDIKPENILFTLDGVPKITDWGIGKFMASEGVSKTSGNKGTLKYSAPEQISKKKYGKIDWQTDVFQLGILFYELLTGENPFVDDDPAGIIGNILHEDVPPPSSINPDISPALDKLILKCLSKKKERRWVSADVLFSQLKRINEQKQKNLKKYRRYLKRVLADGIISKDENELLSEIRGELNITLEEHDTLLSEVKGKDDGKEDTTKIADEEVDEWQL